MDLITSFPLPVPAAWQTGTRRLLFPLLRQLTHLRQLQQLYAQTQHLTGLDFVAALLRSLGVRVQFDPAELRQVPATGAFIVVANHPSGLLDGLVLLHVLGQVRPEVRAVANDLLAPLLAQLGEQFVLVQPDAGGGPRNTRGMRHLLRFLQNDVPLLLFPAGAVAHRPGLFSPIEEPAWHPTAGRLLAAARVPILPVWVSGQNSVSFSWLGLLHPLLRTLRLPAELLNKQGLTIRLRLGVPVLPTEVQRLPAPALLPLLRTRVFALAGQNKLVAVPEPPAVIAETPGGLLAAEIDALRPKRRLVVSGMWEVYVAKSREIPQVLREISRLRELTFREEGEGTQQDRDLDQYDTYYRHLFLYDRQAGRLVGAYRLGQGPEILRRFGRRGFYLHSLFHLKKELKPLLRQSLELGRSFIRPEYQRQPLPLLLLWQGIATYLSTHPEYRYLIGPVSISNRFSLLSKAVMVEFIRRHCFDRELAAHVRPRKQFRYQPLPGQVPVADLLQELNTVETLNRLIGSLECGGLGVPVLLRHYMRQNARFIGFNLDPGFSNALDGFIVLDAGTLPARTHRLLARQAVK
ncbi:lysophospholipid acyltransferase family protein [Hymenobacter sp. BT175]|uniref:lysophospholipid acyltransferase family protein n=1 Tax=Hymenobacter translucens TaxID=2886507 RepID=UPI001D0F3BD8|nr:GNAT family N-acyltransferase [Hymenobacter translucens]MCC2547525.1 lysophospholipid acyltransferase family protein [Hymenobacter translucens]